MKLTELQDSRPLPVRVTVRRGEGNGTPLQDSCLENPMDDQSRDQCMISHVISA